MNDFFKSLNTSAGVEFMDNRNKGELSELYGSTVSIDNFAFLPSTDGDGDYAVFTVSTDTTKFFFGNNIITDMLHKVQDAGMGDELANVHILFLQRKSKKNRFYTAYEFVD